MKPSQSEGSSDRCRWRHHGGRGRGRWCNFFFRSQPIDGSIETNFILFYFKFSCCCCCRCVAPPLFSWEQVGNELLPSRSIFFSIFWGKNRKKRKRMIDATPGVPSVDIRFFFVFCCCCCYCKNDKRDAVTWRCPSDRVRAGVRDFFRSATLSIPRRRCGGFFL